MSDNPSEVNSPTPSADRHPLPDFDVAQAVPTEKAPHSIWHCGDPFAEQRAAQEGAYLDLRHLGVISVRGEDAATWINSLLAQKVDDMSPATTTDPRSELRRGYVLDSQGRLIYETWVARDADLYLLLTPRLQMAEFLQYLQSMVFWSKVELATHDLVVLGLVGKNSTETALVEKLTELLTDSIAAADSLQLQLLAHGTPRELDLSLLVVDAPTAAQAAQILNASNFTASGRWTWDALRVTHGIPELDSDADNRALPHEFDSVGTPDSGAGASTTKGCYRGQETVAKIHNVGLPPRRQVVVLLDGGSEARPHSGDSLTNEAGKAVGRFATVVEHWEYGPMASALVKRTISDDDTLQWEADGQQGSARILGELSYHPEERQSARETVQQFRRAARKRML